MTFRFYVSLCVTVLVSALHTQTERRPTPVPLSAEQCGCSIDVQVTRHNSYEPISDVELKLTVQQPGSPGFIPAPTVIATGTTDNSGNFHFGNLAEGTYNIVAEREGYFLYGTLRVVSLGHPANIPSQQSSGDNVGIQQNHQVTLSLAPYSAISGTIKDATGEPIQNATVQAFTVYYRDGHRTLEYSGPFVQTNARGEYRIPQLGAGEYFVRAEAEPISLNRTFYPNTLAPDDAKTVVVREGEDRIGINVDIPDRPMVSISGTVIVPFPGGDIDSDGKINRSIRSFFLIPRSSFFVENPMEWQNVTHSSSQDPNSTEFPFVIHGVPSGEYDFYPEFVDLTHGRVDYFSGHAIINVESTDIHDVRVVIHQGAEMTGHFSVPAIPIQTGPQPPRPKASVTLTTVDTMPKNLQNRYPTATADDQGNFVFRGLTEGRYLIRAVNTSLQDLFVTDIRSGARSIYFDDAVISVGLDSSDPIEITTRLGGMATIQGTVPTKGKTGRLVLVPDAPRQNNLLLYRSLAIKSSDAFIFTMSEVPPGTYKLFASEWLPFDAEKDPEFIIRHAHLGATVTVNSGASLKDIVVPMIPDYR